MYYSTLAIYDTQTMIWSSPATRGDICRERAFHTAFMWGGSLVIALGEDSSTNVNSLSVLNQDTMYWDSWDGNITRSAAAIGLLEGKVLAVGGEEKKEVFGDIHQVSSSLHRGHPAMP